MSQLGRIGGQVLTDNLLRAGVDLAFETDLLYLDVTNRKLSVKTSPPVYDLDVNSEIATNDLTVTNQIRFEPNGIRISGNTFTTQVGGIDVYIGSNDLFHARLLTDNLEIVNNYIGSLNNSNIVLDPNGTGTIEIFSDAYITGDLTVGTVSAPKNINVSGNLTGLGTLTLGDQTLDTVTVNTDFTQSIIPGDDFAYALGADASDSSPRRWSQLHASDWTGIDTGAWPGSGLRPQAVTVSDQMRLDGVVNKISAIQSNEDILLTPDTGITYIEKTKWQDSDITNLNNTALTLASTGIGYYNFNGTNAILVPAGDNSQRRSSPELGETRWNTEVGYLECFDGTVWVISTGGGEEVTETVMNDLGNIYTLILG
jgi:hypothetical protein